MRDSSTSEKLMRDLRGVFQETVNKAWFVTCQS